jgi:hypothetical protein
MQHTINCVSARSAAHEITTSNLLRAFPEGFNVGTLKKSKLICHPCAGRALIYAMLMICTHNAVLKDKFWLIKKR